VATVIKARCGAAVYPALLDNIMWNGRTRAPRGEKTRDLGYTVIELDGPADALPYIPGRDLNDRIAAAEAAQLIGGFANEKLMTSITPNFQRYIEPKTARFWGAYGRRIGAQVSAVVTKLKLDPDTRQAVITLWDPALDNQAGKRDYPCTVGLQFEVADDGSLRMNTVMRSNDAWLGFPYDVFQFTQLQWTIATVLDRVPGRYRHTAFSMHLYERDWVRAEWVAAQEWSAGEELQPRGLAPQVGPRRWRDVELAVSRLMSPYGSIDESTLTDDERWYRDRLVMKP
jgi:thymidylate synthase